MEIVIMLASFFVIFVLVAKIIINHELFTPLIALLIFFFIFQPFNVDEGTDTTNVIKTQE